MIGLAATGFLGTAAARAGATLAPAAVSAQATPTDPVPGFDDPSRWAGRTLVVAAWGGEVQAALAEALWLPFATATGCTVRQVPADYDRVRAASRGNDAYADLVVVDPVWAETAADAGLLRELGSELAGSEAVSTFGGGVTSVPAYAYGLVNAYHRNAVPSDAPPQSWTEWWDIERFPGPRALGRDPLGTFEIALLADGVAPADLYPLDLDRAITSLDAIRDLIGDRWWERGVEPVAWLSAERTDLASAWHYRVIAGQRDGRAVNLVWDEGLLVTDQWVIPAGAASADVAEDFLRYALSASAQSSLARLVSLGPVTVAAFDRLDPIVSATVPTAPANRPRLVPLDAGWWAANRDEAVQQFESWLVGASGA